MRVSAAREMKILGEEDFRYIEAIPTRRVNRLTGLPMMKVYGVLVTGERLKLGEYDVIEFSAPAVCDVHRRRLRSVFRFWFPDHLVRIEEETGGYVRFRPGRSKKEVSYEEEESRAPDVGG